MPSRRRRRGQIEKSNVERDSIQKSVKNKSVKKQPVDYLSHIRFMFKKLQELKPLTNLRKVSTAPTVECSSRGSKKRGLTSRLPFTLTDSRKIHSSQFGDSRFGNFEMKSSKFFDIFILHENDICTARSIFSEMWDKNTWKGVHTIEHQYDVKRKLIKHVLFVMNNLDMHLFTIILANSAKRFPGIRLIIDDRKKLTYFLLAYIKKDKNRVDYVAEILQLWYIIQPAVLESMKYTNGKITDEMKSLLTNVDALYDWITAKKRDCPANNLCSVSA